MADKKAGAYGQAAAGTDFRRTWDKAEYEARAKKKDEDERERMKEADEAMKQGSKKPPRRKREELPKPTELMKQREDLELEKNMNKTMVVQGGRGPGAPGFYCDVCSRTSKDSSAYLDHLNSRYHLRKLGQKTQVAKSTLDQVRAKIAALREATKTQTTAKQYDFDQRLKDIREAEMVEREERKARKKREKEEKKKASGGYQKADEAMEGIEGDGGEDEMARLMGFSGGFKAK